MYNLKLKYKVKYFDDGKRVLNHHAMDLFVSLYVSHLTPYYADSKVSVILLSRKCFQCDKESST